MRVFMFKHLVPIFHFVNFIFCKHLAVVAQFPIYPNPNDQALLPFGSQATGGLFYSQCSRRFKSAGVFRMLNNCPFTVWAAAIPGGGRELASGQIWIVNPTPSSVGRLWGRTNCLFDASGHGKCETGDCGGVLQCQNFGAPPNTVAEFALNQVSNLDFFDVSLVDGFNIPIEFKPTSNGCSKGISCAADIKGQCPAELRAAGGCNNPCTVFKSDEYCCNGATFSTNCGPTNYSKFFKELCPNAYSYPKDDATSTFTCPGGTDYDIVFCP